MTRASEEQFDEASPWKLERRAGESLRACLERTLRDAIREGSLRAGVELPASRRLAGQLGVSRGVTSDAYAELEAQGYLLLAPRRAPVVADAADVRGPRPAAGVAGMPVEAQPRFDMTPTTPDVTLFPRRLWATALATAVREAPAAALDYGDPKGSIVLREKLADELGRTRGVICDPAQIIVVQGASQAVDLVLRALRDAGARRIAVEDPSLDRQRDQIAGLGLGLRALPVDREGLVVDGLDAAAVIVSPAHQFPTGAVLSGARRRELIAWSRDTGGLVVEDDYDAEFRYDREPVRALQGLHPDGVLYVGTTSKTLAPALRLGWLVAPAPLVEQLAGLKLLLDDFSPTLEQLALAGMLERGHYQRHIRRARAIYRLRRDALVAALATYVPDLRVGGVAAGLSVALYLPAGSDDREIERSASRAGIRVQTLSRYSIRD
ncbi:MAG TPA: PLP-dependent aminotransferase family protein, partial [Solirubrobacteraceae bacterium]|nr:PLP-dependent aminotransferase family protein [Solirubrobacteraceae bacterium]